MIYLLAACLILTLFLSYLIIKGYSKQVARLRKDYVAAYVELVETHEKVCAGLKAHKNTLEELKSVYEKYTVVFERETALLEAADKLGYTDTLLSAVVLSDVNAELPDGWTQVKQNTGEQDNA